MKKLVVLLSVFSLIILVGCGQKDKPAVEDNDVAVEPVVENPDTDTTDEFPTIDKSAIDPKYQEYSLDVDIVSTDPEGVEYGVKTKMYKKDDKSLYVIEEMTGPQELPFTPTQNLLVGSDLYSNITIDGEDMWFKADADEGQAEAMFDLGIMQLQVEQETADKEPTMETIDGQEMACYTVSTSDGKICLVDGMFAYGEDKDPNTGMESIIRVTNFEDTVDDSVFKLPPEDEVKTMDEFMAIMMQNLQASASGEVMVLPEEEIVEGEAVGDAAIEPVPLPESPVPNPDGA